MNAAPDPKMVKPKVNLITSGTSKYSKKKRDESVYHYLKRLSHLHLEGKNLTEIDCDFSVCPQLSVLYLYDNHLTAIPDLSRNRNLSHLYLQDNQIRHIPDLSSLIQLTKLYLSNNCIAVIEGLKNLHHLNELYIDRQQLPPGEKLLLDPRSIRAIAVCLQVLNISGNRLTSLNELHPLHQLTCLYASDNKVSQFSDVAGALMNMEKLATLELHGNPMCRNKRYRDKLIIMVKSLENLDGKDISVTSKTFIHNWSASRTALRPRREPTRVLNPYKGDPVDDTNFTTFPRDSKVSGYMMPGLPMRKHFSQSSAKGSSKTYSSSMSNADNNQNTNNPFVPINQDFEVLRRDFRVETRDQGTHPKTPSPGLRHLKKVSHAPA
ncbi:protein phosphatase 1 regulatory subunit 42-like isoform X2 [Octopus sinensis]|uniref:Protein phosphatase 1 regulatory subunit 42-like isoform X2 n=1 Tax=Octopus sinensis TaxID=2607531 RepID=A0A7E6FL62_9MOLL|nr:protein phosphatase 1 regulatory subunit 42-like isoform X2 [Octopus sinensis]